MIGMEYLFWSALHCDHTLIHENDPVRYIFGEFHLVGYDHHCHFGFCQGADHL